MKVYELKRPHRKLSFDIDPHGHVYSEGLVW